jgi:hypothetical protein
MGHVVRELPWCTIDIDTGAGSVFFRQRWRYRWTVARGLRPWTYHEQFQFHGRVDRVIWREWSDNRVAFAVSGTSDFARRFQRAEVPINFDVLWASSDEHWNVTVQKIAQGLWAESSVNWQTHEIKLDTNDLDPFPRGSFKQIPIVHEFGHAIGYSRMNNPAWGDEYRTTSTDSISRMHVGNAMRPHFFGQILIELDAMIPDTRFTVRRAH